MVRAPGRAAAGAPARFLARARFDVPPVRTRPAAEALEPVLPHAGARVRDELDEKLVADVRAAMP